MHSCFRWLESAFRHLYRLTLSFKSFNYCRNYYRKQKGIFCEHPVVYYNSVVAGLFNVEFYTKSTPPPYLHLATSEM